MTSDSALRCTRHHKQTIPGRVRGRFKKNRGYEISIVQVVPTEQYDRNMSRVVDIMMGEHKNW